MKEIKIRSAAIRVEWVDHFGPGEKLFDNVKQLADFLRKEPELAEKLNYIKKERS